MSWPLAGVFSLRLAFCSLFFRAKPCCLVAVACWAVLPLVVRGTTAHKRYYRPPARYYHCGTGPGGYIGAGEVSSPPYPFTSSLLSLPLSSLLSPREGSDGSPSPRRPSPFPLVESIPTLFSCHGCRYCPRSFFPFVSFSDLVS